MSDSSSRLENFELDESFNEDEETGDIPSDQTTVVEGPKILSRSEASKCLCTLGKCDSGLGYAYLVMDASKRNLKDVDIIPTFKHVLRVNVSGNCLTMEALQVLTKMTFLLTLEADHNFLSGSPKMDSMPNLQVLTLNKNNLTNTEGIVHPLLGTLELNYNRITEVSLDPEILKRLEVLELRGNFLSTFKGINLQSLQQLYLAENEIYGIEGLENLVNLKILHLRDNKISILNSNELRMVNMRLNYINLRDNNIKRLSELRVLENINELETLVILGNPVIGESDFKEEEDFYSYRIKILVMLSSLKRIDKSPVSENERREASSLRKQMLRDKMRFSELDTEESIVEDE